MGFLDFLKGGKEEPSEVKPQDNKLYQTLVEQGKIELESRDFEKAIVYFNKAISEGEVTRQDRVYRVMAYKGRALDGLKRYSESERVYEKAFELKPDDSVLWLMRGLSYSEQGRTEKALKYFDKAFELNPLLEDAMLAKAKVYSNQSNREGEVKCYHRILQSNPESRKANEFMDKHNKDRKKEKNKQWLQGIEKSMDLKYGKQEEGNLDG